LNNISGIYKIICINNKFYIGSSIDIDRRLKEHKRLLKRNKHPNKYLQNCWNKYGEKNFRFEIIETVNDVERLLIREQQWIDKTNCCNRKVGFNISINSSAPNRGKFIDLAGQKFGRLTPVEHIGKDKWGGTLWLCECDCGKEIIILRSSLVSGNTKSCGCLNIEKRIKTGKARKTHGRSNTKIYKIWRRILNRCNNPKYHTYQNYGGRTPPITVCYRWSNKNPKGFENFYKDVGEPPTNKHQIGRKDNNGDYCPENYIWVLSKENRRNRNNTNWLTYNDETLCTSEMANKYNINRRTLADRLYRLNYSIEKALITPVRRKKDIR